MSAADLDDDDDDEDADESFVETPALKKARLMSAEVAGDYAGAGHGGGGGGGRSLRERRHEDKKGPLYFLLDYMQKTLQR